MKRTLINRLCFIGISLAAAAAVLALMFTAARAANSTTPQTHNRGIQSRDIHTIQVNRMISIPYGIDSSATLMPGMSAIEVSGHGVCLAQTDSYEIRVVVSQEGIPGLAVDVTKEECTPGEDFTWTATAQLPEDHNFAAGNARVDALAIINPEGIQSLYFPWWKEVNLEQ